MIYELHIRKQLKVTLQFCCYTRSWKNFLIWKINTSLILRDVILGLLCNVQQFWFTSLIDVSHSDIFIPAALQINSSSWRSPVFFLHRECFVCTLTRKHPMIQNLNVLHFIPSVKLAFTTCLTLQQKWGTVLFGGGAGVQFNHRHQEKNQLL